MDQTRYLFEVVVDGHNRGIVSGQGHQVPIRLQSLLAWQGRGRLFRLVRRQGFVPNGTIARVAHLLKIITYLRKGLYKDYDYSNINGLGYSCVLKI